MASDSPLTQWLRSMGLNQGDLAAYLGIDHTRVSRVACGVLPASGALRKYLTEHAPAVLTALDDYRARRLDKVRATLEAV